MTNKVYCPKCGKGEGEYTDTHREPDAEWDIYICKNPDCGNVFTQHDALRKPRGEATEDEILEGSKTKGNENKKNS